MKHAVIGVPGLGDNVGRMEWAARNWPKKYELDFSAHAMPWQDTKESFEPKYERFILRLSQLREEGYEKVSGIGTSAAGHIILMALYEYPELIDNGISVCGRLLVGNGYSPSLEKAAEGFPAFEEGVKKVNSTISSIGPEVLRKFMVIAPLRDQSVPVPTMHIPGSRVYRVIGVEHRLSIASSIVFQSKTMTDFMKE